MFILPLKNGRISDKMAVFKQFGRIYDREINKNGRIPSITARKETINSSGAKPNHEPVKIHCTI